jgi:hypothetical protein
MNCKTNKLILCLLCFISISFFSCGDEVIDNNNSEVGTSTNCTLCVNCENLTFCGISEAELNTGICNYRNRDWWRTSPYFNYLPPSTTRLNYTDFAGIATGAGGTLSPGSFDARYMDIDIEQLENYLCLLKKSGARKQTQALRLYYIRYPETPGHNPTYGNKHSLAFLPVRTNGTEIAAVDSTKSLIFSPGTCEISSMSNHNSICPPQPPACSDRLQLLDNNSSTY